MSKPTSHRPPETPEQALKILRNEIARLKKLPQEHHGLIIVSVGQALVYANREPLNLQAIRQQIGAVHLLADEMMDHVAWLKSQVDTNKMPTE